MAGRGWDELRARIVLGFVVADQASTAWSHHRIAPAQVRMHERGSVTLITRSCERPDDWAADVQPQQNGRPLLEAFRFCPANSKLK